MYRRGKKGRTGLTTRKRESSVEGEIKKSKEKDCPPLQTGGMSTNVAALRYGRGSAQNLRIWREEKGREPKKKKNQKRGTQNNIGKIGLK